MLLSQVNCSCSSGCYTLSHGSRIKSGAGDSGTDMLLTDITLGGDALGEDSDRPERLADMAGDQGGEYHTTG